MQQVLAFESDLLEYDDLFDGRPSSRRRWPRSATAPAPRSTASSSMGGAVAAVESGYLKSALVSSLAQRRRRIESGEDVVVGLNRFTETEPNPLLAETDAAS